MRYHEKPYRAMIGRVGLGIPKSYLANPRSCMSGMSSPPCRTPAFSAAPNWPSAPKHQATSGFLISKVISHIATQPLSITQSSATRVSKCMWISDTSMWIVLDFLDLEALSQISQNVSQNVPCSDQSPLFILPPTGPTKPTCMLSPCELRNFSALRHISHGHSISSIFSL